MTANISTTSVAASHSANAVMRLLRLGASSALLLRVLLVGAVLLMHLLMANWMTPAEYGIFSYVAALVPTLAIVAKLGVPTAALRFVPAYVAQEDWAQLKGFLRFSGRAVVLALTTIILSGACVLAIFRWSLRPDVATGLMWSFLLLPGFAGMQILQDLLRSFKRIVLSQVLEFFVIPVTLCGVIVAVHYSGRPLVSSTVLGVQFVLVLTASFVLFVFIRHAVPAEIAQVTAVSRDLYWLRIAVPLGICGVISSLLTRIDILVLGSMLGSEQVALYVAPAKLATLLGFGLAAIIVVASPLISEAHGLSDQRQLQQVVSVTTKWAVLGTLPLAICFTVFGRQFLGWFGPEYVNSIHVLYLLILAQMVNVIVGVVEPLLAMTGHQRDYLFVMSCVLIGNLICLPIAVILGGVGGAAAVSLGSMVIWKLWLARIAYVRLGIDVTIFHCFRR